MDVRRIVTQLTRGRKAWIWVAVVALVAFTVSSALSQPASKSKEQRPALQTQPLPATEPAGEEPVFKAYQSPEADVEAAAKKLQAQFAGTSGVRVAADERTGKLLIVAPPEVHRQLAGRLTATEVGEGPTSRPASPRVQKTLSLKNTKSRDFEVALTKLVGRQLPATTQRNGQVVDYTIVSRGGNRVIMSVDRQSSQVTFDGPADLVAGWVRVAGALDARPNSKTDDSRVVPFSNSNAVASGAVQKALSIFGQQVSQTRSEATGRLVSMQLQPREGARANQPNANQPDAKEEEQKDDQQPPAQPQVPPPADVADPEDLGGGLIGPVQIEFLEALDQIVIRGHPRDVERVEQIIRQIEALSEETVPVIEVYNLQHVDSEAMALFVNNVYTTILSARQGPVSITALVKPNALLLIGRDESVRTVIDLIERLDKPAAAEAQFQIFTLRHTSAIEVETTIREFLGVAQPGAEVRALPNPRPAWGRGGW